MNEQNWQAAEDKRKEYMDGKITHDEFYLWLADFIGADKRHITVNLESIRESKDEHFNDIPLRRWDQADSAIRRLAYKKGLPWSLSSTVCVAKALARKAIKQ